VSEYQYYEFAAVDRPLDRQQQAELRSLSTRADITATSFINTYEWGDFKGDPRDLMARYFDAHLYLANWGSRRLMVRLPAGLLDLDTATEYCVGDSAIAWATTDHVVLDLNRQDDEGSDEFGIDGYGRLGSIIPVRAELAAGDLRLLYVAWLRCVQSDELSDEEPEPPVPAGMRDLTGSLAAVVEFLDLDKDLLAVAASASPDLATIAPKPAELRHWIAGLPTTEKDAILGRLITGADRQLRGELLRRYRVEHPVEQPVMEPRTAGQLIEAADQVRAERVRRTAEERERTRVRQERAARQARQRHLDELAVDEPAAWRQVATLIDMKRPREYDIAVQLLVDLRELSDRDGRATSFRQQLVELRARHARKPSLLERLDLVGLNG